MHRSVNRFLTVPMRAPALAMSATALACRGDTATGVPDGSPPSFASGSGSGGGSGTASAGLMQHAFANRNPLASGGTSSLLVRFTQPTLDQPARKLDRHQLKGSILGPEISSF